MLVPLCFAASCKKSPAPAVSDKKDAVAEQLFKQPHILYSRDCLVPAGATVATKEVRNLSNATLEMSIQGQTIKGIMAKRYEHAYTASYLSDSSMRLQYQEDKVSGRAIVNGKPAPQPNESLSLHKKTIIFNRAGDSWSGTLEDGVPTTDQKKRIEELARHLNATNYKVLFGEFPRKVGDSWDIEATKLDSYMGSLKEMQGLCKVRFQSLRKHQGHDCAVIVTRFNLTGEEPEGMEMQLVGRAVTLISLDYLLPLSMEMKGEIAMDHPIMEGRGRMRTKGAIELERESVIQLP